MGEEEGEISTKDQFKLKLHGQENTVQTFMSVTAMSELCITHSDHEGGML